MLRALFKSRLFLIIETIYLLVLPLVLIKLFRQLIHLRIYVLLIGLIYVFVLSKSQSISFKQLGFRQKHFLSGIKAIIRPTITGMILCWLFYVFFNQWFVIPVLNKEVISPSVLVSVLTYIFISAPLQEFVYRGFLISRLELVSKKQLFLKIYNSLFFMLIHTPFNNIFLTVGSFILGWFWATHFLKYRNIFSVMLSHILIGSVYIILMGLS